MHKSEYANCIKACNECADTCDHCATACLTEKDAGSMTRCIQLAVDCAAVCRMAAGVMARGSEFANQVCRLCADICAACGDECARFDSEHCRECAEACRRCAEECRRMAG